MSNLETDEIQDLIKEIESKKREIETIKKNLLIPITQNKRRILENNLKNAEEELKALQDQLKALQAEEETQTESDHIIDEYIKYFDDEKPAPVNEILQKKPLYETITPTSRFMTQSETTDEYIDEPTEEEDAGIDTRANSEGISEDTKEIKDDNEFDDDPEAVADDELGMLAENITHDALMDSFRDIEKKGLLNEMPPAVIEEEKASQKLAAKIVAKEEPKKNLALLSNTLANLPTSIMPYVADSVASTLLDAKDENGLPIFESKNEIIKLLKDLRNSKLRKGSKSGKKKVGKTKSSKGKHERDYMDYMLTKRINPAILITPKMRH